MARQHAVLLEIAFPQALATYFISGNSSGQTENSTQRKSVKVSEYMIMWQLKIIASAVSGNRPEQI